MRTAGEACDAVRSPDERSEIREAATACREALAVALVSAALWLPVFVIAAVQGAPR